MRFINVIDERGRFCYLKIDTSRDGEQVDSHTYSYLGARRMRGELYGKDLGLGREERAYESS